MKYSISRWLVKNYKTMSTKEEITLHSFSTQGNISPIKSDVLLSNTLNTDKCR